MNTSHSVWGGEQTQTFVWGGWQNDSIAKIVFPSHLLPTIKRPMEEGWEVDGVNGRGGGGYYPQAPHRYATDQTSYLVSWMSNLEVFPCVYITPPFLNKYNNFVLFPVKLENLASKTVSYTRKNLLTVLYMKCMAV